MDSIYRDLAPDEVVKAKGLEKTRTQCEMVAYRLLPKSMKEKVERNSVVAFKNCNVAFSPDMLLRNEKICIEIDGGYHILHQRRDKYRNAVFRANGYIVIRIKNQDTSVDVAFWQQLLAGLEYDGTTRENVRPFIDELRKLIDDAIRSWTRINPAE